MAARGGLSSTMTTLDDSCIGIGTGSNRVPPQELSENLYFSLA
jgi:hypothetical protein